MQKTSPKQLTLFAVATRANRSLLPGSEEARKMTAISGRKCYDLYENVCRLGLLPKMLLGTLAWGSTKCFLTWKEKATPGGRLLFQLAVSMPPTEGTGSGLLLTPNAMDALPPRKVGALEKQYKNNRAGRTTHSTLREQVAYPPPSQMWPTPRCSDGMKNKLRTHLGPETNYRGRLEDFIAKDADGSGYLNPLFVEQMMGFPIGWTELKPSEMQ